MARNLHLVLGVLGTSTAVALIATLSLPPRDTSAFSLLGHSLGIDQRDFRVFNNFADAAANDNTVEHPAFPGSTGAVLAIRKAHAEWGSVPRNGNGHGDGLASNPVLGNGGANLDQMFLGEASTPGNSGDNTHHSLTRAACDGAVIAFVQFGLGGGSNGWRITYCDGSWVWSDGPGYPGPGQLDLQAIATREIGFALGLGHSSAGGFPTMAAAAFGDPTNARSIEVDDIAGLQAIYGAASATKPRIDAVSDGAAPGQLMTISGSGFHPTDNEIWVTPEDASGLPVVLGGVRSSAGGTTIVVAVPSNVASGDLMVHVPGSGGDSLSNAWSFSLDAAQDAILTVGDGLGGTSGEVPQLTAAGDLTPGSTTGFSVDVQLAAASVPGILFLGSGIGGLPFKGGFFQPVPILAELPFATDAAGNLHLSTAFDAGVPSGLLIVSQAWFADVTGPVGVTGTNGLALLVP
jgi:hypothetical protein